jgi:xylan 1,4-beta-xylosidase
VPASRFALVFLLSAVSSFAQSATSTASSSQSIIIDSTAPARLFPHFWEEAFGSGRAILSLRESYRNDLRAVKAATDFKYVRFHAILHDEVDVYGEDEHGNPIYNFTYVGQIYDGLLDNGVRPIVEISFMPKKLAARQDLHPFWYKQNVSPPKDYAKWDALVRNFAQFLVDRYGIDEVSKWYFEVWNEPNIDFWSGEPKQATYFELYEHTARALKAVNAKLRVGGPASSSAHWVDDFIAHTTAERVPVDFVSTHGYADDSVEDYFGTHENIPIEKRMCRAVEKVHNQIKSSAQPQLPLLWTEWNVSGYGPRNAGETSYSASAISESIRACDGLVDLMSFWTFSDVFEENGPAQRPLDGGFGLVGVWGIKKPSFYAFSLLHKLGDTRLANSSENVIVTRRTDGSLAVAVWNLYPADHPGPTKTFDLQFSGVPKNKRVLVSRIDQDHSNTRAAYERIGKPRYPTEAQVREMNSATALQAPQSLPLKGGHLSLIVPANGFALLEVPK